MENIICVQDTCKATYIEVSDIRYQISGIRYQVSDIIFLDNIKDNICVQDSWKATYIEETASWTDQVSLAGLQHRE